MTQKLTSTFDFVQKINTPLGISFLDTIILLGAVQSFIISILMFASKKNRQSNRLLSHFIWFPFSKFQ